MWEKQKFFFQYTIVPQHTKVVDAALCRNILCMLVNEVGETRWYLCVLVVYGLFTILIYFCLLTLLCEVDGKFRFIHIFNE